jgi:prepilin-type N-terminal cleavage/methylation domain-containing protein
MKSKNSALNSVRRYNAASAAGFSLLELLISVAIMAIFMTTVILFVNKSQMRAQSDAVVAESNQSARETLETMEQEIGQAGYNPLFSGNQNKTAAGSVAAKADPQCVTLNNITQINPGDWLAVDTGGAFELVQVLSTSAVSGSTCAGANQISAVFEQCHNDIVAPCPTTGKTGAFPIISYKQAYPSGILQGTGTSSDNTLELFGDVNADGTLQYVVYSLHAPANASTLTINGVTYTLYTVYRSITPLTFAAGATNNQASPLVQNVLYNTTNAQGPTGQPIFSYPVTVSLSLVPKTVTVVGTVAINLCIAVNPHALEMPNPSFYTMSTQVRPMNLAAAVAVNNAGGAQFLPAWTAGTGGAPLGLPMSNPANYYP